MRQFPRGLIVVCASALLILGFTAGMFLGRQQGLRAAVPEGEGRVLNQGDVPAYLEDDVDFRQFWDVWNLVKESFYRQPVSDKALYYGAIKGMVSAADDRYTVYFDPEEAAQFTSDLEGNFDGIGAEIGVKDDQLTVVAPLPDSPAEKAGLMAGDRILFIDDTDTTGMAVEEAVSLIRGPKGTQVTLTITHDGVQDATDVTITRDTITVNSVEWKMEGDIAYISIYTFNHDTSGLFNQAVNDALAANAKGIILDLRGDPGGLLTSAIDVASAWVGYDTVVIEKSQGEATPYPGVSAPRLGGIPTVVLVDGGSASGSEIVAGALQDYGYATIVGAQTFGKGSVQDYQDLADGSAVKITVAEWNTPKGRTIHEVGITPDAAIDYTIDDFHAGRDPQKDKAVEILRAAQTAQ
jgi:carboxyl-terminal processing protease